MQQLSNPQQLVSQSGASDTAGLVDYLLDPLHRRRRHAATRAALGTYLGDRTLSPQAIETRVRGLVQLVLASPEYQLN